MSPIWLTAIVAIALVIAGYAITFFADAEMLGGVIATAGAALAIVAIFLKARKGL